MVDTKLSALTTASALTGSEELYVNQAGNPRKVTLAVVNAYTDPLRSAAVAAQTGFATDTYVTGSRMAFPQTKMQAGVFYRARLVITKTAAGVVAPVFNVRVGTAGTTADTARLTYTGVAQTAVIDTAFLEVLATIRVHGVTGNMSTWLRFDHDLAATGFANATRGFQGSANSTNFDTTAAGLGIGISMNGGTSAAWTVQQCVVELLNLAD